MSSRRVIISSAAAILLIFCIAKSCQTTVPGKSRYLLAKLGKIAKEKHIKGINKCYDSRNVYCSNQAYPGWKYSKYGLHKHKYGNVTNHIGGYRPITPSHPGNTNGPSSPGNTDGPNRPGNDSSPGNPDPPRPTAVNCGSPHSEITNPGNSKNLQYPGLCDNNICPGSSDCGPLEGGHAKDEETNWYTLGEKVGDDYLIAQDERGCSVTDMVNFTIPIKYPISGCKGLTVTYVTFSVESRNGLNSISIIGGGIGQKSISINVTAESTNFFYWTCDVFGYAPNDRAKENSRK